MSEDFGTDAQRTLLQRGRSMHEITVNSARHTYYGRTVGLVTPVDGPFDELAALARLQGNTNYAKVPNADMPDLL